MSRILLDQPYGLNGVLNMAVNPRTYEDLQTLGLQPIAYLQALTRRDMLVFVPLRGERYSLYTHQGSFSVRFSEGGVVLLTSFRANKLRDNNDCLRLGVSVRCTGGFSMSIKIKAADIYRTFLNGNEISDQPASQAAAALRQLLDRQGQAPARQREPAADRGPHELPPEMKAYLDLAETYAAMEDDLERANAQQSAPLMYYDLQAAVGFDRQDRMAYTVCVDDFDEEEYGPNKKVQVELENGAALAATILTADKTAEGGRITLLFEDQVSYSALPKMGAIRPTYSDVQFLVRSKVIQGLRRGGGKAAFLEQVLGPYRTAGFENKDLRALDAALQKQKYPPNASQIEAIHRGINTKDIMLVMGPPGTGKTTVILEWVKYFIKQEGKRVLISSQNNKAVDNVLERLTEEKDISAIRAGNEAKVQANMYPYLLENRIRQLQTDMETQGAANLQRLRQQQEFYQAYKARLGHVVRSQNARTAQSKALEQRANALCAPALQRLQVLQPQQEKLLQDMAQVKNRLRSTEYLMGDPERNPLLRMLLTPVRKFLWAKAEQALEEYTRLYKTYTKNRQSMQECYQSLTAIYTDPQLLDIAAQQTLWEVRQQQQTAMLQTPPQDGDIFPELVWPDLKGPLSSAQLQGLAQQLQLRISRLEALRQAVEEWNTHIQAQSNYALSDLLMESVDLVGGTCIGINSQRKFAGVDFDVTIIDEAGQIQIHNALVPMSRSPKVIMLGDHKQIPPIASPEQLAMCEERGVDPALLNASLFERLYENLPDKNKIMLDTQYRMPAQLGDLLSEWFYDNRYYSFQGKRNMPSASPRLFKAPFVIVDTSAEPDRHEYKPGKGAGNRLEAELIALIVRCMADPNGPDARSFDKFGIISPYGEQVENMRRTIRRGAPFLKKEHIYEMVASLDSFQGQERKIILYSCTRSNTQPPERSRIGFLKELRRLNVALSRPKEQLVFVGDMDFLAGCKNGSGAGSEREFSAFITLMKKHAAQNGEILTAEQLRRRVGGYYG